MSAAPSSTHVAAIVDGPTRSGSELRWDVELTGGGRGVLAQLLPELARDEAVRRRYVADLVRRAQLNENGLAPLLDHSAPDAAVPWRLRRAPEGTLLSDWLAERAPAPVDEVADLGARLGDVLHDLHAHGVVVRDLHPKLVVLTDTGPVLTDVGLARVDLLSTRTAASLILEGSPYASPEQLRKTILDQRSDLFGLGVILWRALTGSLPYGDRIALLAEGTEVPPLQRLRADVPDAMETCVRRCIDFDPERRPASAREVSSLLRGEATPEDPDARVECQSCGANLRLGQRLCTHCGKQAVIFQHAPSKATRTRKLVLKKVKEDVASMAALRETLETVSNGPIPALNFIVGDQRMYSKEEQASRLRLPLVLFDGLEDSTASALAERFTERGVAVEVSDGSRKSALPLLLGAAAFVMALGVMIAAGVPAAVSSLALVVGAVVGATAYGVQNKVAKRSKGPPLLYLRKGPAALPASDPLVARLSALIDDETPEDVRERIGELALAVQRVVDHRATLVDAERDEVDMLIEPIEPLIGLVEAETGRLATLDRELADLDEGKLVRALSSAEARGATDTERNTLLESLDRLRGLEDQRAAALHRLLEAASLLRRAVSLGLEVQDPEAQLDRDVQAAIATLEA